MTATYVPRAFSLSNLLTTRGTVSTVTFTLMDGDARGGRTGDDGAPRKSLSVSFVISVWIDVHFCGLAVNWDTFAIFL